MNFVLKLTKLFFKETFSPENIFKNSKTGKKSIAKGILYGILILYCIGVFGFMYFSTINALYISLNSIGKPEFVLYAVGFSAFIVTFFFGFLVAISTYSTGGNEEFLFSLPLKVKDIFTAKFLCTVLNEMLFSVAIIFIGAGIYGFYEGLLTNPLFYLEMILSAVAIPVFAVGVIYLILVVFLFSFKILRNKALLNGVLTVVFLGFYLWFFFTWQKLFNGAMEGSLDEFLNAGDVAITINKMSLFFPIKWFGQSIALLKSGKILLSVVFLLLLAVCSVAIPFVFLPILTPLYQKSLIGFNETKVKKISKGKETEFIQKDIKATSIKKALFKRDILAVFREPGWLLNGPCIILILPLVMGISIVASLSQQGYSLAGLSEEISPWINEARLGMPTIFNAILFWISLGGALFAVMISSGDGIASTAISREGKGLSNILAMPLSIKDFTTVKIIHAMLYCVISTVLVIIFVLVGIFVLKLPFTSSEIIYMLVNLVWCALSLSFFISIIEIWFDTLSPKLKWENPTAVFKQNLSVVLSLFMSWGILVGIIVLSIFVIKQELQTATNINVILTVLCVPLWRLYQRFADKKLKNLY